MRVFALSSTLSTPVPVCDRPKSHEVLHRWSRRLTSLGLGLHHAPTTSASSGFGLSQNPQDGTMSDLRCQEDDRRLSDVSHNKSPSNTKQYQVCQAMEQLGSPANGATFLPHLPVVLGWLICLPLLEGSGAPMATL